SRAGQPRRQKLQCTQVSTSSLVETSATERLHHALFKRLQHWGLTPLLHVGVEGAAGEAANDARRAGRAQVVDRRRRVGRERSVDVQAGGGLAVLCPQLLVVLDDLA